MHFEVVGSIEDVETIAVGGRIRDIMRLRRQSGEDYLYPETYFVLVRLPQQAQHAVLATA